MTVASAAGAGARRVLVTGAAGFIGRHLVRHLLAAGHDVVALVSRPVDDLGVPVVVDEMDEPHRLLAVLQHHRIEHVVHGAWRGHPRAAGVDHVGQLVANVHPALNLFVASAGAGVAQVIFLSTGGGVANLDGVRPAYGTAKRLVEGLLEQISVQFDLVGTVLRPSAVYGPGQDPTGGLGAVATFARKLLLDEPIELFGSADNGRDFLHVTDLARLVTAAVDRPTSGTFGVGGPVVVRLRELLDVLEQATGHRGDVRVIEATGVEPAVVQLDNRAATDAFGWQPVITVASSAPDVVADLRARLSTDPGARR